MRKAIYLLGLTGMALAVLCLYATSVAGDEIERERGFGDEIIVIDDAGATQMQQQSDYYLSQASEVKDEISSYAGKGASELSEEKVRGTRRKYHQLPDAYKVRTGDLGPLAEAEEALKITYAEGELESDGKGIDPGSKTGKEYSFEIKDDGSASITVQYLSDDDSNGKLDAPSLRFVSPSGTEIVVTEDMSNISSTLALINITRQEDYLQADITQAVPGNWKIRTSSACNFIMNDYSEVVVDTYTGIEGTDEEAASIPEAKAPTESPDEGTGQASGDTEADITAILMKLLPIMAILGSTIAALGLKRRLAKRKQGSEGVAERKNRATATETPQNRVLTPNTENDTVEDEKASLRQFIASLEGEGAAKGHENIKTQKKTERGQADAASGEQELDEYCEYPSTVLNGVTKDSEDESGVSDEMF